MSEALSNVHFIRPAWLLLIPLALGLWWFWRRSADPLRGWREQMDADLLGALVVGKSAGGNASGNWLLAAWLLASIAIAGPTWRREPNPFAEDAQPLIILLKAGESMEQMPPAPSRLERARLKIADLAEARKGQPLGLIAYAGSAHLALPPTRDTQVVSEMAAQISPAIMPESGDRLDLAIAEAGKLLDAETGGSLLIIADSSDAEPQAISTAHRESGSPPVQFLALVETDSPETKSLEEASHPLHAALQELSVDDSDINAIVYATRRKSAGGVAGETSRWQEAGYWLTPLVALIIALSFRRQRPRDGASV